MPATGLLLDPAFRLHHTGSHHSECPERLDAIEQALGQRGLLQRCRRLAPRPISDAELLRCHSQGYLHTVRRDGAYGRSELSTGDTAIGEHSEDVALAARHAQTVHGLERVMVVDWDVHHGNGTQAIFWRDPSVFYLSVHEWGNYPGSGAATERGEGPGAGTTVNCPLPAGSDGATVLRTLEEALRPAAARFRPQLLLLSAGFDGHRHDPLGRFQLSSADYGALTACCLAVAAEHCGGRLLSVLEGGYHLGALGESSAAHLEALLEAQAG